MIHKCKDCGEDLEDITFSNNMAGDSVAWLSHKETATLYACTSADCRACGAVLVIPHQSKEEEED